jgi:hypothetical protein
MSFKMSINYIISTKSIYIRSNRDNTDIEKNKKIVQRFSHASYEISSEPIKRFETRN